jgi:hypothetical protein
MPAEFRYLTRQGRSTDPARLPSDTVEASYKRADLIRKLVVRDELQNRYLVFGSRAEFYEWYAKVPEAERACHEVIFGWRPQRFKFDVDAPAHKLDALSDGTLEAAIASATTAMGLETEPTVSATELDSFIDDILGDDEADPPSDQLDDDDPLYGLLDEEPAPIAAVPPTSVPTPEAGAANPEHVAKIRAIVNVLIDAILDELYTAYFAVEDLLPTRTDIAVTDSSGPTSTGWKYSFHIIVMPYFAPDHEEAREMSTRVIERLPESIRSFVDPNVYKKTQNFRMAGSAKPGTGRFKHLTAESAAAFRTACDVSEKDLLITAPVGARVLERVYTEGAAKAARGARVALTPQDPIVRAALDLADDHGVTQGHTFVEVRGTLLCFERSDPSHCRICNETHHKDNSLMISIDPAEGGHSGPWPGTGDVVCRIVEHCRQVRGKGRLIGEVKTTAEAMRGVASAVGGKSRAKDKGASAASGGDIIAQRINGIREGRVNPHDALASEFERLPEAQKTIYAEDQMRDYELTPTLAVLAQMKLGKTKAMRRYVDEHFSADSIETKVVRFVTFRQTFSRALTEAFPDFINYNDVQGDLDHVRHPRLIVQVESLHRIRMFANMEPVDLMILDEVESILAQFNSGLHKHFNAAFAMFQWMMRTARHVVCMDANLSDRTYRTLLRMRPAHPPHFHWNRFSRAADDVYHFTADHAAWLEKLYECARDNKKIVLPTNSLSEARAYEEALHREFPKKKIMLYSSETAPSEKALHFGDVHTYWKDLDVLIYTPTCSAGVSFELEHFDVLFGYFCDISCDVETCRQMLGPRA